MSTIRIRKMDVSTATVELPEGPWYMATIYGADDGDLDNDDTFYMRDVVVLGAADARAAKAAARRGVDAAKGEVVDRARKTDRDMAAYYLHTGDVVYAEANG